MTDPPSTIAEAQTSLKKKFSKIQFVSATPSFLTANYQRSPTSRVKVKITLTFLDGYASSSGLAVSIEGTNVPPGLKKKLQKDLGEVARGKGHTYHQIEAALQNLIDIIDTNHFVPCWKELRQVVELMGESKEKGDTIGMKETSGLVKLTLNSNNKKYHYRCSIYVDAEYPNTAKITDYGKSSRLKVDASNLPDSVKTTITKQAQDLVRRLQDGMSEEHALKMSNPIHLPSSTTPKPDETPDEEWQRKDQERRSIYGVPLKDAFDGSHPQPSLLPLVAFLHTTVHQISTQTCPACNEKSLPADPATKLAKSKRPIQVHCGHWYHWGCFNEQLMNQPPFGVLQDCSECNQRIYHPDWPEETATERERAYQQRQAKEREIADAADFF
jgi:hypothetical protein